MKSMKGTTPRLIELENSAEILTRLKVIIGENFDGLRRQVELRKILKAHRQGRLRFFYDNPLWAYNICAAGLIVGHYDWIGWECRSDWSWYISNTEWIYPRYAGQPCKLIVLAEQGLGDELLFSSCLHELYRDNPDTTIEVDDRLIPIFARSFPSGKFISRYRPDTKESKLEKDYDPSEFEAFIPFGNVPKLYRKTLQSFPGEGFIKPGTKKSFDAFLSQYPRPWIGIAWEGRQGQLPLQKVIGKGSYFSLQYDLPRTAARQYQGKPQDPKAFPNIHTVPFDVTDDLDGLFSFVSKLDRVVTLPQTLAHVAGSLGKEAHVIRAEPVRTGENFNDLMFHNRMQWQWTGKMPWYNSVKVYRNIGEYNTHQKRRYAE